jgi:hypothetical protein
MGGFVCLFDVGLLFGVGRGAFFFPLPGASFLGGPKSNSFVISSFLAVHVSCTVPRCSKVKENLSID